eukprot:7308523-Alexandrium_andersonii.AAC.1
MKPLGPDALGLGCLACGGAELEGRELLRAEAGDGAPKRPRAAVARGVDWLHVVLQHTHELGN